MDVSPQPDVVGQIPANVIRVFIDYDLIGAPVPVVAVTHVVGRHAKIEAAKPEPARTASRKAPYMAFAKAATKVPMLPRMIEMVVRIIFARAVSNPGIVVCVNVRSFWVTRLIGESARCRMVSLRGKLMLSFLHWGPRSGWMC